MNRVEPLETDGEQETAGDADHRRLPHQDERPSTGRTPSLRRWFWGVFAVVCAAGLIWGFTTPLGGFPDEPAHVVRAAAVVTGQLRPINDALNKESAGNFIVPGGLANAPQWDDCFAHKSDQSASCEHVRTLAGEARVSSTAAAYDPVYYAIVGWPSLLTNNPVVMVWGMRALTAAVSALLMAAAIAFLRTFLPGDRVALIAAAICTPTVLGFSGAVNPNAWEITGVAAILGAVLALGYAPAGRRLRRWAFLTIGLGGFIVANVRGITPLWIAVAGVVGMVSIGAARCGALLRSKAAWISLAGLVAGVAFALWWDLYATAFTALGSFSRRNWSDVHVIEFMLRRTVFEYQYIGLFGWNDSPAPLVVVVLLGGLGMGAIVAGLWLGRGRPVGALVASIACWLGLPTLVQLAYAHSAGIIWQGRYSLVMYVVVVVMGAMAVHARFPTLRLPNLRRLAWIGGILLAVSHVYTLATVMGRWANGTGVPLTRLLRRSSWAPPGGNVLWLALAAAVAAAGVIVLVRSAPRSAGADGVDRAPRSSRGTA